MDNSQSLEARRIWGALWTMRIVGTQLVKGEAAPQSIREWRSAFRHWAGDYALYLTQNSPAVAPDSMVIHPPFTDSACLEIALLAVGMVRLGEPLDLDDPLTFTLWLDFLNDHASRREHWTWWKDHRGEFHYL